MDPTVKAPAIRRVIDALRGDTPSTIPLNMWITDSLLAAIISSELGEKISCKTINQSMVHTSYGFNTCEIFDGTNDSGVFRKVFRNKKFYYIGLPQSQLEEPNTDQHWANAVVDESSALMKVLVPPSDTDLPTSHTTPSSPPVHQTESSVYIDDSRFLYTN